MLNGVLIGGIYSLMAIGLSLIFGVSRVLNIAHGEFIMLGGLTAALIVSMTGLNPFLLIFLIVLLFTAVGFVFELTFIKPLLNRPHHVLLISSILVTFGLALVFEDTAGFLWGTYAKGIPYPLPPVELGGIIIPSVRLIVLVTVVAITVSLWFFLKNTYVGMASRAVMMDREGAILTGVNISWISMVTFGIGGALASVAGVFYAMLLSVEPYMGLPLTLTCLCIIVLGGVGSMLGTLIAGLIIGLAEVMVTYFFGLEWAPTVSILILIVVLMIRPKGLFGLE